LCCVFSSFHSAGLAKKNVTSGVPRLKEIIDCTHNMKTPSMTLYLRNPFNRNKRLVDMTAAGIMQTNVADLTRTWRICNAGTDDLPKEIHPLRFKVFRERFHPQQTSRTGVMFNLNRNRCIERGILPMQLGWQLLHTMKHAQNVMNSLVSAKSWWTFVFVDFAAMDAQAQKEKLEQQAATQGARVRVRSKGNGKKASTTKKKAKKAKTTATTTTAAGTAAAPVGTPAELKKRRTLINRQYYKYVSQKVTGLVLKGIAQVQHAFVVPDEKRKSYRIETDGSNLSGLGVLDVIDHRKSRTNDIHEVLKLYGIEAACNVINAELYAVMTADGASIQSRHIQQLTDTITHHGFLTPMSRHGMASSKLPTLHRASFEETKEVFSMAAIFGEEDKCNGVTDAVILGKRSPIGTGIVTPISTALEPSHFDPFVNVQEDLLYQHKGALFDSNDDDDDVYVADTDGEYGVDVPSLAKRMMMMMTTTVTGDGAGAGLNADDGNAADADVEKEDDEDVVQYYCPFDSSDEDDYLPPVSDGEASC